MRAFFSSSSPKRFLLILEETNLEDIFPNYSILKKVLSLNILSYATIHQFIWAQFSIIFSVEQNLEVVSKTCRAFIFEKLSQLEKEEVIDVRLDEGTVGETRRVTSSRLREEKRVGRLGDRFLTAKFRLPLNETVKIESNVAFFSPVEELDPRKILRSGKVFLNLSGWSKLREIFIETSRSTQKFFAGFVR